MVGNGCFQCLPFTKYLQPSSAGFWCLIRGRTELTNSSHFDGDLSGRGLFTPATGVAQATNLLQMDALYK